MCAGLYNEDNINMHLNDLNTIQYTLEYTSGSYINSVNKFPRHQVICNDHLFNGC